MVGDNHQCLCLIPRLYCLFLVLRNIPHLPTCLLTCLLSACLLTLVLFLPAHTIHHCSYAHSHFLPINLLSFILSPVSVSCA